MSPHGTEVRLDCVYRREWPDGFGAGGWKLRPALDDPNIIASPPVTGQRIPSSVFVIGRLFELGAARAAPLPRTGSTPRDGRRLGSCCRGSLHGRTPSSRRTPQIGRRP